MSRVNNSGAGTNGRGKASGGKRKVGKAKSMERVSKVVARRSTKDGRRRGRAFQPKAPPERQVVRIVDLDPFENAVAGRRFSG